uniref:Potassium channel tetramerisation-type BTB domain-containing protein n=1 Tax=Parascaris univalens TaxID=6257 RepID=A0A915AV22_PARUN
MTICLKVFQTFLLMVSSALHLLNLMRYRNALLLLLQCLQIKSKKVLQISVILCQL